jgi:hypothetical protein
MQWEGSSTDAPAARRQHRQLTFSLAFWHVPHQAAACCQTSYEPGFLVRLINNLTVVLEIKGYEDDQTRAKHSAARGGRGEQLARIGQMVFSRLPRSADVGEGIGGHLEAIRECDASQPLILAYAAWPQKR